MCPATTLTTTTVGCSAECLALQLQLIEQEDEQKESKVGEERVIDWADRDSTRLPIPNQCRSEMADVELEQIQPTLGDQQQIVITQNDGNGIWTDQEEDEEILILLQFFLISLPPHPEQTNHHSSRNLGHHLSRYG